MEKSNSIWDNISLFAISLIIFVFTFPEIDPTLSIGVDGPFAWAYNYLFAHNLDIAKHMVFPYGPLAFLMYPMPLGNNLDIAFWVLSFTRLVFIFTLLRLGYEANPSKWLLHAVLTIMLCEIVNLNIVLVGATAAALIIFHLNKRPGWLIIPIVFTALGLYTRASVGITNSIILVSYAAIYLYQNRGYKIPLYAIGTFTVTLLLFWLMLHGSFEGFFNYFYGLVQLSKGSSAATSFYPDNDWWLLSGAMLLFFTFPFIAKNPRVNFIYGLFLLSVFAVWKHGMSREDLLHARGFFCHLVLFFVLILLSLEEYKKRYFIIIGILLALVYRNLTVTFDYREYRTEILSVNQFFRWLNDRDKIAEQAEKESDVAIAVHKLPEDFLNRIGNTPVDIYPWDFSFIPANHLEWHPRIVPQCYASYIPWLDKQNADYFEAQKGAEFIIWHMAKDRWGGNFSSIDDRYVLNNEPQTILKILDNYTIVEKYDKAILFEKDKGDHLGEVEMQGEAITAKWNQWIKVPETKDGIQRARVNIKGTLWRSIKNQLYKDETYSVEYRLRNGEIKKYRIVPDIAAIGLWVNPLIMQPQNGFMEPLVTDVRFTCTNYKAVKDDIQIQWQLIPVNGKSEDQTLRFQNAFNLFGKNEALVEKTVLSFLNDLEQSYQYWSLDNSKLKKGEALSGDKFMELEKGGYSHTFEYPLDSIYSQELGSMSVSANAQVKVKKGGQVALVVSASDGGEPYFWEAVYSEITGDDNKFWVSLYFNKQIALKENAKLKVFLWNVGEKKAYVDDIEVKISY